ncbi:MAG: TetR/AcrR family transcriptional regulator [Shimia sp.]|uniref:TetR/AcrR family transcriptional regulator n=1 Tax=Shimia sp. TaxID=1954381 RepID=UPI004059BE54
MSKRLNKDDWLQAGFIALAEDGVAALKAEPMARRLKTTKGSFYWHFADVPAFHDALLTAWEAQTYASFIALLEDQDGPVQKLRALGKVSDHGTRDGHGGIIIDPTVRAWARSDPAVSQAVARVDAQRMQYLSALMTDIGLTNPELVRILYAACIGMADLSTADADMNGPAMGTLVDLILALYQ